MKRLGTKHSVAVDLFFLCRPYVTRTQYTPIKNPQNSDDSFSSLGSSLTTSQHDDEYKDDLNELHFFRHQTQK